MVEILVLLGIEIGTTKKVEGFYRNHSENFKQAPSTFLSREPCIEYQPTYVKVVLVPLISLQSSLVTCSAVLNFFLELCVIRDVWQNKNSLGF